MNKLETIMNALSNEATNAFECYEKDFAQFMAENGYEPNWAEQIVYWDDNSETANWFWGGDAERDNNTSHLLRFPLSLLLSNQDEVETCVRNWLAEAN